MPEHFEVLSSGKIKSEVTGYFILFYLLTYLEERAEVRKCNIKNLS